jgi:hypothetical protein
MPRITGTKRTSSLKSLQWSDFRLLGHESYARMAQTPRIPDRHLPLDGGGWEGVSFSPDIGELPLRPEIPPRKGEVWQARSAAGGSWSRCLFEEQPSPARGRRDLTEASRLRRLLPLAGEGARRADEGEIPNTAAPTARHLPLDGGDWEAWRLAPISGPDIPHP